ncbi:MAG: T9SS type A sorting domain-containing protein, partial [Bacteroidota bacterium]
SDIDFTDGVLETNSDSLLIVDNDATATNAWDPSHTNGPVRKVGNDAFTFPVGNGEQYLQCGISAPAAASDIFTATYLGVNPWPMYDGNTKEGTIENVSSREYWDINRDNGSSAVQITLSWDTNSGGVGALNDLLVIHWETQWLDEGNAATSGNTTTGTITSVNAVNSFSPFTLGSTTVLNTLPIELLSFEATKLDESSALLEWVTATEINNDFFTLERSADGVQFEAIGTVPGAINSSVPLSYDWVDRNPLSGWNLYRLKQTDLDGTFTYSEIRQVRFDDAGDLSSVRIWPNPVTEKWMNVETENRFSPIGTTVEVRDMAGRLIATQSTATQTGYRVQINGDVAAGYYILHIRDDLHSEVRKFTVQ